MPQRSQAGARAVFENANGAQARAFIRRLPHEQRKPIVALAREPGDGRLLHEDLSHVWSRGVIACAFLMWSMRRKSRRNGMRGVVDGVTQRMLCAVFRNRSRGGRAYSRGRLFATSYRRGVDTCGWMTSLRRVGWLWVQPRSSEANPRFLGPARQLSDGTTRRFAFAVYWLADKPPSS